MLFIKAYASNKSGTAAYKKTYQESLNRGQSEAIAKRNAERARERHNNNKALANKRKLANQATTNRP